ncbi:MAG: hypothetical protein AAGA75_10115 [Cyanobacteria bacterium P01_E01_bin.6]
MVSDRINVSSSTHDGDVNQDLLNLVLGDDASYPWEPTTQSAAHFFADLEQSWVADQTSEELASIDTQGQAFFAQLDQQWNPAPDATADSVQINLVKHFGDRVPQALLSGIAQQAQALLATQQPIADQLVQCVQDLLSGWTTDDLLVLARPYAYAMRSSESDTLEAALRSVRCAAWTELSGIEQARLSLAIARYTISKLPNPGAQ